ncbi:hypothetical protein CYFUS_001715 [Cystobacter fuscus]|uniref:Uncharacterized protein n=1 Tax=Cystobacter fuscus TaxID=43 RepID=A0A250IYS5_9BACT|nr:hypothetical protein CYFUS_001715 [Cystobacter fuscus]
MRGDVRAVADAFRLAALPLSAKRAVRRALARVLWTLRGRARAVGRERDDALMQASAAAERACKLERCLADAEVRERQAMDQVAELESMLDKAGVSE